MGKKVDVLTFNKMLHGWAEQGNLLTVKMLYKLLLSEGLQPDMGTHAARLHCYGKCGDVEAVEQICKEMTEQVGMSQCLMFNFNISTGITVNAM